MASRRRRDGAGEAQARVSRDGFRATHHARSQFRDLTSSSTKFSRPPGLGATPFLDLLFYLSAPNAGILP